ncbi:Ca2+-binding EF-hand superfamily protein [Crossiella equi]|uniref:Ca2+-binding EF-hand superfamily protein n=1 Tax=Crossiella equi TaxID=130796 RepID=A0ABS5A699_9PSEU|nr:EF-hand domain-containing protein [Crossiella equi]MBP2472117.1 Ca2+-binding EF-hand superfamily protein [Crossiella equi]
MNLPTGDDLLDRKIDVFFSHLDQNGDGQLETADALALAARIVAYVGEPFSSPKAHALFDALEIFWQAVNRHMDPVEDGLINPDEWRDGMRRAFAMNPIGFEEGFRPLAEATLNLLDRDNDGRVTTVEFAAFQRASGTSPGNSIYAFSRLDRDGDGALSVAELLTAWREFYTSFEANAPGNWLYGDIWYEYGL